MLTSLCIKNFAIVSALELDFSSGLTAFTGETGAGKSIMIDALMLALGGRADASVIRRGAETCDISACFQASPTSKPMQWLNEQDIANEEGLIILRRVIHVEGRSKSYINGQPFPLQKLKELSEMLVDIHGQHQHQTLLQHGTHRDQLDQYANHKALLDKVENAYRQCQYLQQALQELDKDIPSETNLEQLQQSLDELQQLAPEEGEMQALHEEHQLLHHARDYLEHMQCIKDHLSAEEHPNVCRQLHQILQRLAACPGEQTHIKNASELINSALIQCEETLNEIAAFSTQIQLDPERLYQLEERISELHQAGRKYHVDPNQLPAHARFLQEAMDALQHQDENKQRLKQELEASLNTYEKAALALRASRQQQAPLLAKAITTCIQTLGMPKGYITIDITPLDNRHIHGLDKVEYKVCTNPGMAADTLVKVASGGELSRIGLAIHMITAQRATTPTLLFDEVDVGIGGVTAALVGQLLRELGTRLQVFCVTHQPQVASCAHHHFMVEKQSDNEQTFSSVICLTEPQKIDELARMLGGLTITEQTRSHARELLVQSHATSHE